MSIVCDPAALVKSASCLKCIPRSMRDLVRLNLWCATNNGNGLGKNLIPAGSQYVGATPTFSITIQPFTSYIITWGANDVSATVGSAVYNSTGAGTTTTFYSGTSTTLTLTGTAAGTTVTAVVRIGSSSVPLPTGLTASQSGNNVAVAWDHPPSTVTTQRLYSSTDNVNFTLWASYGNAQTSATISASGTGTVYIRLQWCNTQGQCSGFATTSFAFISATVLAWKSQVVTNGGATPSNSTITALDTFWKSLVSNGLDSMMYMVNAIVPDSLIAAITPLFQNGGNNPWVNGNGFVLADLSVNGLQGNASKYLDTGLVGETLIGGVGNLFGMTVYCSAGNSTSQQDMGAQTNNNFCVVRTYYTTNGKMMIMGNMTINSTVVANWAGFMSCNRRSTTDASIYAASSTEAFHDVAGNGATADSAALDGSETIYCFASNLQGTGASQQTSRRHSFFALHKPMTAVQCQNFYNAVQTLRTNLGGGFV